MQKTADFNAQNVELRWKNENCNKNVKLHFALFLENRPLFALTTKNRASRALLHCSTQFYFCVELVVPLRFPSVIRSEIDTLKMTIQFTINTILKQK